MGFLRRLFGQSESKAPPQATAPREVPSPARPVPPATSAAHIDYYYSELSRDGERRFSFLAGGSLSIEKLDFDGEGNLSEDGRYLAGWSQPTRDARGLVHGMWVLLDHAARGLIEFGGMGHPGPCFVASDATVLVVNETKAGDKEDWYLAVEDRYELWVVVQPPQRPVRLAKFSAAASDCGISADGSLAFYWLSAHRRQRGEGLAEGEFVLFDLRKHTVIGRFVPECGAPDHCELDGAAGVVRMLFPSYALRYAFDGTLMDRAILEEHQRQEEHERQAAFDNTYGYGLIDQAHEMLANAAPSDSKTRQLAVELFRRGLEKQVSDHTRAVVHRTVGEVLLSEGRKSEALAEFQAALRSDPKIGLKRREAQLRHELEA